MREPEPFEIDCEDNLQNRQNLSPILETLPIWLIRHICKPESKRGPKIPKYYSGYQGGTTYSDGYGYYSNGVYQPSRNLNSNPESWAQRNLAKYRERHARKSPATIEKGNLPEQDYRFWEGTRNGPIVKCRWCGRRCDSPKERAEHFRSAESKNCSKLLRIVYEAAILLVPRWCFVCSKITTKSRWGIPMCQSVECITDWKFKCYNRHDEFNRRIGVERAVGHFRSLEGIKTV